MTQEQQEERMFREYMNRLSKPDRDKFCLEGGLNVEIIKQNALRLIKLEEGEI